MKPLRLVVNSSETDDINAKVMMIVKRCPNVSMSLALFSMVADAALHNEDIYEIVHPLNPKGEIPLFRYLDAPQKEEVRQ